MENNRLFRWEFFIVDTCDHRSGFEYRSKTAHDKIRELTDAAKVLGYSSGGSVNEYALTKIPTVTEVKQCP